MRIKISQSRDEERASKLHICNQEEGGILIKVS